MEISQYLNVFIDECAEHLQTLSQALLELENDPANPVLLNTIFRAAHTLKGASMTMGFEKMSALTSAMEDVLSGLRNNEIPVAAEVITLLFDALDLLSELSQGIAGGREEDIEILGIVQQLRRFISGDESGPSSIPEKRREMSLRYTPQEKEAISRKLSGGGTLWHINVTFRSECLLKGARAFMVLRELERFGEIMRSAPDIKDLEDENFEDSFIIGLFSREAPERIADAARRITDVAQVSVDQTAVESIQIERRTRDAAEAASMDATAMGSRITVTGKTVRVDIKKLDDLMNLVGELVNNRSRLEQIGSTLGSSELNEALEQIARLTSDLQNNVLKVRMVPVDNVFRRFPRLVRDLCMEIGKQANLVIKGGETELDRTVIDEIGDPLMHILRNCLDHGVEMPEKRQAAGKPPVGRIELEARQEGNSVMIKITDDGMGIDLEKVRAKATEMGIIDAADVAELTPEQIAQLVFAPGLSTAEKVTAVSGRGVGMDVVYTKIDSLRGTVSIETKMGLGTAVLIRLPLTLAIIQALMVQLGTEFYFIPSSYIDSTISVPSKEIRKVRHQEVTMVRGEILPLIRLQNILDVHDARNGEMDELDVVVIRQGESRLGCIVDSLLRQQDIVLKPTGGLLGALHGIAGATLLGNGNVAFVLDVRSIA